MRFSCFLSAIFSYSGLLGTVSAAHVHAATAVAFTGTAGVATTQPAFAGFTLGANNGAYNSGALDMNLSSNYNASFITNNGGTTTTAYTALSSAAVNGKAYLNLHTTSFGGGEIRGFLTPVPEPGSAALLVLGGAMGLARRRRK